MIRKDIYKIDVQDDLYLLVFHKTYNGGFGAAVSLYIYEHEFLKFDCFGENKGHYHIYDKTNDTIYFTEKTSEEQISCSCYELTNNIFNYLKKSSKTNIVNFTIDMVKFVNCVEVVKTKMLEYERKFYSSLR